MYIRLGEIVSRRPIPTLVVWVFAALLAILTSPSFLSVWQDGEFTFLPEDAPSQVSQRLFLEAFPEVEGERFTADSVGTSVQQDPLGSSVVIVLVRNHRSGLTAADRDFIEDVLIEKLERIQQTTPAGYDEIPIEQATEISPSDQIIKGISTLADRRIGPLLQSPDQRATLIVVELKTEFLDRQNALVVGRVEQMLASDEILSAKPLGLAVALSGSATVGRDMLRAEALSASRTEAFTKILVVFLLLLIYRAPLLALVPLITVGVAVELTQALLRHLAGMGWIGLFTGLEVYVTVVVYGAGVDYCLFLIARYKEELDGGADYPEAIANAIRRVGAALATSAGTSICGIGMMGFAEFGKFRQAGFAISFGLFVVLCFAVTFTPALLLVLGKYAFWPDVRREQLASKSGWMPVPNLWKRFRDQRWLDRVWEWIASRISVRPASFFLTTIGIMLPFALIGAYNQDNLSYGLLTDLPSGEPSVRGAKVVQRHFPGGITGPVTSTIQFNAEVLQKVFGDDLTNLRTAEKLSKSITEELEKSAEELGLVDIRNQTYPLGTSPPALEYLDSLTSVTQRTAKRTFAHKTYTSLQGPLAGSVMRLDLVFEDDPFSRQFITELAQAERVLHAATVAGLIDQLEEDVTVTPEFREELSQGVQILSLGSTAGIRDLKASTDRDRILIDVLVVVSVYLVLVLLLRQPAICAYLMVTVIFTYLVSLGLTFVVFYLRDPANFEGIDWKVPIYLFTILIAMGEDYNILLMARVKEEQQEHGLTKGVLVALTKTGSIISSCGIIMAGTFLSLMMGTLLGMIQLGFALAAGVMLDTFIVRPILVPAYLVMLYEGHFGWFGRFLGSENSVTMGEVEETSE